jgi:hypothetical protein
VGFRVDGVSRVMSLIHDLAAKLKVLFDHKVILEPQNSLRVLSKTLCFTQLQHSSDVLHSDVHLLSGDDVFLDGWNKAMFFRLPYGTTRRLGSSGSQQEW